MCCYIKELYRNYFCRVFVTPVNLVSFQLLSLTLVFVYVRLTFVKKKIYFNYTIHDICGRIKLVQRFLGDFCFWT